MVRINIKAFTLIELLIVIVIIATLTSVAIPTYIRVVEKVRAGEAITNLELIRAGEKIYRLEISVFSQNLVNATAINNNLALDIEPRFWSYGVTASGGATFTATANRDAPGSTYDGTITINQAGTWGGSSPFVP